MINPYALIGSVALIAGLSFGWYQSSLRLDIAQTARATAEARATSLEVEAAEAKRKAQEIDTARLAYINQLETKENEIETLRTDLASTHKRLSIRASCPKLPAANDSRRAEPETCTLDPAAEQAYIDLRKGIEATEAWVNFCFDTLNVHAKKSPNEGAK